ncbi:superoxide dismutase [Formicincola oecophyllae]|uniref:Superoxide dismutase n=1 Tax=Formicincola oecophyllae TaxID=2558361 RepID=A0A4Y6UBC6_9PROT|nr:superoxide dismutase [Formicincola oecophyllae]QDH13878.1 superoxide dismutase [Formicincola oecophyllae]
MAFVLPPLPFAYNALASKGMSPDTLYFHHDKHHAGYVNTLNGLVEKNPALQGKSLEELIKLSAKDPAMTPVFNNAGQVWNHNMFWESMSPEGGRIPAALEKKIIADFGSVENFKKEFKAAAGAQFGSGWVWLVQQPDGKLAITRTPNAASPISEGHGKPLLAMDVWEHAYYLDFQNRRPDFTGNWLDKLADYEAAERRMNG